jgi:hypothetical protein
MKKNKDLIKAVREYLREDLVPYKEGLYYFKSAPPGVYNFTGERFEKYWTYTERQLWKMISRVKEQTSNGRRESSKQTRNRKIRYTDVEKDPNTKIDTWEWN